MSQSEIYDKSKSRKVTRDARDQRETVSKAEQVLWRDVLKNKQMGVKFLQKATIGEIGKEVIVDFYCSELKLVLQIDGNSYDNRVIRDLKKEGLTVLKYAAEDIFNNMEFLEIHLSKVIKELER